MLQTATNYRCRPDLWGDTLSILLILSAEKPNFQLVI